MIRTEMTDDSRIRHYSNAGYKIRQIETGNLYDDAVDYVPCIYTYEETDIVKDEQIEAEDALQIMTGGRV